jgi:hypothetical protein
VQLEVWLVSVHFGTLAVGVRAFRLHCDRSEDACINFEFTGTVDVVLKLDTWVQLLRGLRKVAGKPE